MPHVPIVMPQLGESIAEATVIALLAAPGDQVEADQAVMEVETNKATTVVTCPRRGVLARWTAKEGEAYAVGFELGQLLVEGEAGPAAPAQPAPPPSFAPFAALTSAPMVEQDSPARRDVAPTIRGLPVPVNAAGASYLSPRLKARMQELGLHAADLAGVAGSGAAGRVTIQDFEKFIASLERHQTKTASSMRVAVADAMRRSWTRPLATVALPLRIDAMLAHRRAANPKPGPALYALRALGLALGENSAPAGRLVGNKIVHPAAIDLGFAVEAEDGVLVPVLRDVSRRTLAELAGPYQQLVDLARQRKLPSDATGGSIATVTNFGTFGLTWATPIPLPEQTLVLGMGAGRKVPGWDEAKGQFVPITEANLTLSFDHRVLDGGGAGRLLSRIAELLGQPELL